MHFGVIRSSNVHAFLPPNREIIVMLRALLPPLFCVKVICGLLSLSAATVGSAATLQKKDEELVDLAQTCPGVLIELRYATNRNLAGTAIYPGNARALLRRSVAERIRTAQEILAVKNLKLKIWDAYRPPSAQDRLWAARPNPKFVGNPDRGGSLHSWGVAVDVTLADQFGRELRMPTDFDALTPAAGRRYSGKDPVVAANLALLQTAMVSAGFLAMRDEWWHFVAEDYRDFGAVTPPALLVVQ